MTKVNNSSIPFDWEAIKNSNTSPILKGLLIDNSNNNTPLQSLYDLVSLNFNTTSNTKTKTQIPFVDHNISASQINQKPKLSPLSSTTNNTSLTTGAQSILKAMNKYGAVAKGEDRITIAKELDAACKFFKVDPKLMLAVFAHESAGINPKAKSHTGAKGLGQLTGIAIDECIRLAKLGKPGYKENLSLFQATKQNRYPIKNNIWTSVAYMKVELGRNNGVKNTLKDYGDPYVKTYANKVATEYKDLWGQKLGLT
jgi:hypothetical protein